VALVTVVVVEEAVVALETEAAVVVASEAAVVAAVEAASVVAEASETWTSQTRILLWVRLFVCVLCTALFRHADGACRDVRISCGMFATFRVRCFRPPFRRRDGV
jgi:hypothetical protein